MRSSLLELSIHDYLILFYVTWCMHAAIFDSKIQFDKTLIPFRKEQKM